MTRDAISTTAVGNPSRPTTREELLDMMEAIHAPWEADAACRGRTDLMFGHRPPGRRSDDYQDHAEALALCAVCTVKAECAELGANQHEGIWGGVVKDPKKWPRKSRAGKPQSRSVNPAPTLELLRTAGGWWSCRDIGERIGVTERTARRHIVILVDQGAVDTRIQPDHRPTVYRAKKGTK